LADIRMEDAKDRLQRTDATVAQIAEQLGFSSTEHFAKTFKRQIGTAPQSFRKLSSSPMTR